MSGPASLNSVTLSFHSCAPFYVEWCSSFPPSATVRTPEHHQLTTDGQTICQVSGSARPCFHPDSTPQSQALTVGRKGETSTGPEGNLGNMILKNQIEGSEAAYRGGGTKFSSVGSLPEAQAEGRGSPGKAGDSRNRKEGTRHGQL